MIYATNDLASRSLDSDMSVVYIVMVNRNGQRETAKLYCIKT